MNAIEMHALNKHYRQVHAVRDVSLSIPEGEVFALLGINGAGKTTLLRMLACLATPTSGEAFIFGHSIRSDPQGVKALLNVSPQETAIAPNLSVAENLALIAAIYGCNRQAARERTQTMAHTLGLGQVMAHKARRLSGGWQRRLSLAMALITDPRVLFLDEPTLGLDVLARRELWALIEGLKGRMTIILTTHYLEEAQALADRIGILVQGSLRALGTADELTAAAGAASFEDAFITLAAGKEPIQ